MAFTVSPTSGVSPYVFEADILNKSGFNWGLYSIHLYTSTLVGSCSPPSFTGSDQQVPAQSLLNTGMFVSEGNDVPSGSCRTVNLVLREVATGTVIDSSFVTIDNL